MLEAVYFDMVHAPRGGWSGLSCREWLFWPALCYRVVAPEAQRQERNLFERTILGLTKARVYDASDQGRLTGLDVRLIEAIKSQLTDEGLLTAEGRVTDKGDEVLHTAAYEQERLVTGYVFQDPYTGTLWDRFVEEPRFANVEINGHNRTLVRGATGRPFRTRAFAQHHPQQLPPPPGPEDVCRAIRRCQRSLDRIQSLVEESRSSASELLDIQDDWGGEEPGLVEDGLGATVTRVTFLDAKAVPCYLATCLYSRSPIPLPSTLLATDPFLPGASDRLMRQILDTAHERRDSPLAVVLNGILERTHGAGLDEFRAQVEALRLQAEHRVEERLGFDNRDLAAFGPLVGMERAFLEAEALGDAGHDKERDAIASARDVLEAQFRSVASASRLRGIERHVDLPPRERTPQRIQSVLERAATSVGLQVPLPTHLTGLQKLTTAYGRLRSVSLDHSRLARAGIRDLFEVCLLAAVGHPDHPLACAAAIDGAFAERLFALADIVNAAKHGDCPSDATPEGVRLEVYGLLEMMLGRATNGSEGLA
tara:strand:+ start:2297 stop:3910 length:1614 start_codon:yes stop_codon:yes gene_type:complete